MFRSLGILSIQISPGMQTMCPGCSYPNLYDDFMTMLDNFGLVQIVTEPTRHENVLDLFLTTNQTQVQKTEIVPGISDHEIMVADANITPQVGHQKPRNVPLYRKADWDDFWKDIGGPKVFTGR